MAFPDAPALRIARALLRCVSVLVPHDERSAWMQEWEAEVLHHWPAHDNRCESGSIVGPDSHGSVRARNTFQIARAPRWRLQMDVLRRLPGALVDAVWLRRQFTVD